MYKAPRNFLQLGALLLALSTASAAASVSARLAPLSDKEALEYTVGAADAVVLGSIVAIVDTTESIGGGVIPHRLLRFDPTKILDGAFSSHGSVWVDIGANYRPGLVEVGIAPGKLPKQAILCLRASPSEHSDLMPGVRWYLPVGDIGIPSGVLAADTKEKRNANEDKIRQASDNIKLDVLAKQADVVVIVGQPRPLRLCGEGGAAGGKYCAAFAVKRQLKGPQVPKSITVEIHPPRFLPDGDVALLLKSGKSGEYKLLGAGGGAYAVRGDTVVTKAGVMTVSQLQEVASRSAE